MKKILPLWIFLLASTVLAQAKKEPPKKEPPKKAIPLCENYENVLKNYDKWSKNISNSEHYKNLVFEIKPENENDKPKTIKFQDLSVLRKDIFYLYQAQICSNELKVLEKMWSQILVDLQVIPDEDKKKQTEKYKDKPALKRPPTVAQLKEYIKQLLELRKKHAVKYETVVKEVFKKHVDEIPTPDRQHYLKKVIEWNDNDKLIVRKKKPAE